jgi:hypothetical protein
MKRLLACFAIAALPALAQQAPRVSSPPAPAPLPSKAASCTDCGVVTSVKKVEKQNEPATDAAKPSGLVATMPLGGGKAKLGPSQKLGGDTTVITRTWEVIVRRDDGRFQLFTLNDDPGLVEGDKIRIDNGKPVKRGS